jgi:hypothetical protein
MSKEIKADFGEIIFHINPVDKSKKNKGRIKKTT